jgi:hypothetical protein
VILWCTFGLISVQNTVNECFEISVSLHIGVKNTSTKCQCTWIKRKRSTQMRCNHFPQWSGNSQVRVTEMSNHIFPKPTDSAVYTPLPTTSSPNSHLQIINLEQHLHMRRGRSFVEGEWRPFVEVGGRPRRSFVNVGRRPQASKSKIQGERPFVR